MSALAAIQQEWAENSENKLVTGVLLWDISVAFDTSGATNRGMAMENFVVPRTEKTFIGDTTRLWNVAPSKIQNATSLALAKR